MPTDKNIMIEEEKQAQLIEKQKQEVSKPLYDAISEALAEDSKRPNQLSASALNKIVEGQKHETEDPLYDGISKALADYHLSENLNPEVIGFSINKN